MTRIIIARILYLLSYGRIHALLNRSDSILSIYGHDEKKDALEKMVRWLLKHGYTFITPQELYCMVMGDEPVSGKKVWLSFDDGWKESVTDILPVLEEYHIPATFFISTKGIQDGYYWFSRALQNRNSSLYESVWDLWRMPDKERILKVSQLPAYKGEPVAMNADELRMLAQSDYVYFGNHTHDHIICDQATVDELEQEIARCGTVMRDITGIDCNGIFSYPNGNVDDNTVEVVKKTGFKMAVTTNTGMIHPGDDPYRLKRAEIKNGCLEENILQAYGIWTSFFGTIKKILSIKNRK